MFIPSRGDHAPGRRGSEGRRAVIRICLHVQKQPPKKRTLSVLVTTSKARVTSSDARVTSSDALVTTSKRMDAFLTL